MELSINTYDKIKSFINKSLKNDNLEFELRFNHHQINEKIFESIFNKLTFKKINNGLEFKYKMMNYLDIFLKNENNVKSRMTVKNNDAIKKHWIGVDLEEGDIEFIEKEKIENMDDSEFNFRCSLSKELPKNNFLEKNMMMLKSNQSNKFYRMKNRYSIMSPDNLFQFDLTITKDGYGTSFKKANVLKAVPKHEIEIEFNNKLKVNKSDEELTQQLIHYLYLILSLINNSDVIMSEKIKTNVLDEYYNLINYKDYNNFFIAANPVTLHKINLIKNERFKNLYNKYAVTLKADGVRYLMMILKNGDIYYFNNNKEILDSGYRCPSFGGSLIEGEMIDTNGVKKFYAYDMLFSKDQDIRNNWLVRLKEGERDGRINVLDKFLNAKDLKLRPGFNDSYKIEIKKKIYKISKRSDGSDIFKQIKEIWDSRKFAEFYVDGLIFVPITEHYKMVSKGAKWESLFKWKPPELNSIDFLVKFLRDENGQIVNSPYIENVKRLDNKSERKLKLYQTLELYVGGRKNEFNKKKHRMVPVDYPVLFNPLKKEDSEYNYTNTSKIFINTDQKVFCIDPLTNEKEEIQDDSIVECSYNSQASKGFNWVPIRNRHDKTKQYKKGESIFGNNEMTANDIFRSIMHPVDEEMITTGKLDISEEDLIQGNKSYFAQLETNNNSFKQRFPYQNFHNQYIKSQLFYIVSPYYLEGLDTGMLGKIFDGCSGKGVDITKIKNARYAEVVGMEIDESAVQYAQDYYKSSVSRPKPKAFYVRGDLSKLIFPNQSCAFTESGKIYTKKYIPEKHYFDTMCLMFCVHYFFQNEITLRTIIQNMNDALKINGYIIGTCFDGANLYKLLQNKTSISGQTYEGDIMWKIDKKYKGKMAFGEKNANLGKKIDVFVKTIGNIHEEYLVNFKYFEKIMKEYGFKMIMIKPFEDFYNEIKEGKNIMKMDDKKLNQMKDYVNKMSEEEKRFSFLSSAFIFQKEEHSSDSLYTKLVKLIEKETQISKDSDISLVSKDEEGIIIENELLKK